MKKRWMAWLLVLTLMMGSMICVPVSASAASKAKLSATSKMIEVGKSFTLKVTGTKLKVKYSTANKAVATVTAKGKVTAKKVGKTTITAKVGKQTLKCAVRVTYKRTKFTLRGQSFSIAIPPTWTYKYRKTDNRPLIEFYYKDMYERYDGKGSLMYIDALADNELADFSSYTGYYAYGKLGKYNFGASNGWGSALSGNQKVDDKYLKMRGQTHSVCTTFLPAVKSAKQRAYNAYFQYLTRPLIKDRPFALAYITNDNIPELIINSEAGRSPSERIVIYTYRDGYIRELCATGMNADSVGYYYKKNVVVGVEGFGGIISTTYYNASKNKKLLNSTGIMNSGRRVFTYSNASGKQISKATFNKALKKYTGGKTFKKFAFYKNTLKNRKKYLNN